MIENLQDQAQITLAQFTQIHNPTQPTRYVEKIFACFVSKTIRFLALF